MCTKNNLKGVILNYSTRKFVSKTKPASFYTSRYSMSIPLEFSKKGDITHYTTPYRCREQVASNFIRAILNNKINKNTLTKARILLFVVPTAKLTTAYFKKVLVPIHLIENECNMPKTTVKLVKYKDSKFVMFEGSIKWYRSSQTMSLWHLLIRFCTNYDSHILNVKTLKKLYEVVNTFKKHPGTNGSDWILEDKGSMKESIHLWIPLMKNLNEIFPPTDKWTTRYSTAKQLTKVKPGAYRHSMATEGIYTLGVNMSQHRYANKLSQFLK